MEERNNPCRPSSNPLEITRRPLPDETVSVNFSTVPPFRDYNPLPSTPPPSYTPRKPDHHQDFNRAHQQVHSNNAYNGRTLPPRQEVRLQQAEAQLAAAAVLAAGNNRCRRHNESESSDTSRSSRSSSNSSSSSTTNNNKSSDEDDDINNGLSRRNAALRVNGAYCPDLLNACSLILPFQESDSSPERQSTNRRRSRQYKRSSVPLQRRPSSTAAAYSSSDYAEIDEINNTITCNSNVLTSAKSTPTLYHQRRSINEGCVTNSITAQQLNQMGQNLSLRRPRISLTWVLREQQNQHQSSPQPSDQPNQTTNSDHQDAEYQNNNNPSTRLDGKTNLSTGLDIKKKLKAKQNNNKEEDKLFHEKYVSNHNLQQQLQEKREPSKDLMFVCTPSRQPISLKSGDTTTAPDSTLRRRFVIGESKKVLEKKCFKVSDGNVLEKCEKDEAKSLKGTYSEPSLIAASEGHHRRHRHRKRRDRNRVQKFGYEIRNVDEFLSKCSLASPGNIPVVLSSSSTLYQTRPGGYQIEIPLPLGMVVNAVFKNQNWLYVQTPHAEEGYVGYNSCLPLGILPPAARGNSTSKPTPCWDTNGDVFPRPCGNMTDSEKEIRLRGGTRSDGARTPRLKRIPPSGTLEHHVDKLYLRAASQPKLTEKAYAQLKSTNLYKKQAAAAAANKANATATLTPTLTPAIVNSCNASVRTSNNEYLQQHKTKLLQKQQSLMSQKAASTASSENRSLRQTLVAIMMDYATQSITLQKGEIVTLCECRESKDRRQWFYVRTRDGREGYIPAEVAGHGFL
ncbi:uncharacterized protein LOC129912354 [Episyrphus balteatus]|uniref:uncharacterized protein LOC129912354 n=1 Tax=Episyrphus balteatus TaxID=286459 RepID=UPI002485FE5B|nr:uncharacterized protein LOC129912354 [Episyrphus balteatus]